MENEMNGGTSRKHAFGERSRASGAAETTRGKAAPFDPGSRDSATPWAGSVPIAFGTTDDCWLIEEVSEDVKAVTDRDPADCIGRSLLDLVHPDDVALITGPNAAPRQTAVSLLHVRGVHRIDSWVPAALLLVQLVSPERHGFAFAIIRIPRPLSHSTSDRVVELESCLRRIGSEVCTAGVLHGVHEVHPESDQPRLGDLTSRQWEILNLLRQGERVATISEALFISQSTVRNHLATIFRKFGVHSQPALLQLLRPKPDAMSQRFDDIDFVRLSASLARLGPTS
jgi:DNA-binding CsgD family transcriptional regulator